MTTRTVVQAGPVSDSATFGGSAFSNGDSIANGGNYLLTVDIDVVIGDGSDSLVLDMTHGQLAISAGKQLQLRGNALSGDGGANIGTLITLAAGAGIEFDGNSGVGPKWEISSGGNLTVTGTSPSRCYLRTKSGTAGNPGYFALAPGAGNVSITLDYFDASYLGTASTHAIEITGGGSAVAFTIKHGTVDHCGLFPHVSLSSAVLTSELSDVVYTNLVGNNGGVPSAFDFTGTADGVLVERIVLMGRTFTAIVVGMKIHDCYLDDAWEDHSEGPSAEFTGNFCRKQVQSPTGRPGDLVGNYFYQNSVGLGQASTAKTTDTFVTDNIYETAVDDAYGSFVWMNESGNGTDVRPAIYRRNIMVKKVGMSRGFLWANSNTSFTWTNTQIVENNTLCSWSHRVSFIGDSIGSKTDTLKKWRNNLCVSFGPADTLGSHVFDNFGNTPENTQVDVIAAANITNNCNYRLYGQLPGLWSGTTGNTDIQAGTGYNTPMSGAVKPGANDISVHPRFVDDSRNLLTWDAMLGGAGTEASALARIQADPTLTRTSLIPWVRAGYQPTHEALRGAGYDGSDIGALAMGPVVADYLGYARAKPILYGATIPASDLEDHSVLIRIVADAAIGAALSSRKFAVVLADKKTEIGYGAISYSKSGGAVTANIRVRFPTWASDALEHDIAGYLCYDDAKADRETTIDAVGQSVVCYLPMEQDPGGSAPQILDWSGNGNHFTANGSMTSANLVPAVIDNGLNFVHANSDCITLAFPALPNTSLQGGIYLSSLENTLALSVKVVENVANAAIFSNNDGNAPFNLNLNGGSLQPAIQNNADTVIGPTPLVVGTTYRLHATNDGTTLRLYVDGIEVANTPSTSSVGAVVGSPFSIGGRPSFFIYSSLVVDDFLHDTVAWSPDRIAFDVENINNNASTVTLGAEINPGAPGYTLTAPTVAKCDVTTPSDDFTVELLDPSVGTTTLTPTGARGGTFTPATIVFADGETGPKTFTLTPVLWGNHTIACTNDGDLGDATGVSFLGMVQIGKSGTASTSGGAAAGNITPSFGGFDTLANGSYFQWFKRDCRAEPVDDNSDYIIGIFNSFSAHILLDFSGTGAGTAVDGKRGVPINIVPGDQPLLPIGTSLYNSDPGPVPIPPLGSYEGEDVVTEPPSTDPAGDRHMLIYVRNETTGGIDKLWEVYQIKTLDGGNTWESPSSIAKWNLDTGIPRARGLTGTDAASLPIAPMLLKYEEVASGDVGHVIRSTFPGFMCYGRFVHPARSAVPFTSDARRVRYGARIRLRQDWYDANIDSFSGQGRVIAEAMRKYGVMNTDITGIGTGPYINGVVDDRWDMTSINALNNIPLTAFEVVKQYPAYTVTGPTHVNPGEQALYTASLEPIDILNFGVNIYIYVNGVLEVPGISNASVGLTDSSPTATFYYNTPLTPGTFVISFVEGNQEVTDFSPITLSTMPVVATHRRLGRRRSP